MPLNKIAVYPTLLSLESYNETQRKATLLSIYERDIFNNTSLKFRNNTVRPMKAVDSNDTKLTHFSHLTCKTSKDEDGIERRNCFDLQRSKRLHWVRYHILESSPSRIKVFNYMDRIRNKNYLRTYIYDEGESYIIILEPKRDTSEYMYIISAYYLDEPYAKKQIDQKYKKRLK